MDVIADRHVETVVVMASSQVGKTEILLNLIGYHFDIDPGPILMVEPTLEMAGAISKDRIAPMLRDTPVLRERVGASRTRNSSATLLHKTFPGGTFDPCRRQFARVAGVTADPRAPSRRGRSFAAVSRR